MTRAFWDSQFKFSTLLPDFAACLDTMSFQSAAFAKGRDFQREAYGSNPRQWVETCAGSGPQNLLPVVIHGGYWRALEAESHRAMMAGLTGLGAYVANVEYRLMPDVRLGDVVADVTNGLTKLAEQMPKAQLLLVGHSAGAHLALSALASPVVSSRTAGVIAISGLYELWPVAQSFLQDELRLTPNEIATYSLDPNLPRPPVLYLTGADETHEFHHQSARMATKPRTAWQRIPDTHHMTVPLAATSAATASVALKTLRILETQE